MKKTNKAWIIGGLTLFFLLMKKQSFGDLFDWLDIDNITDQLPKKTNSNYSYRNPSQINKIIVHHTATSGGSPQSFANHHINTNGWPGIGYHFVIDKYGYVWQTNHLETISYHTAGQNTNSIGIALIGDFDNTQVPADQYNSLIALINNLNSLLGGNLVIQGHREFKNTSCPGANLDIVEVFNSVYSANFGAIENHRFIPVYRQLPKNGKTGKLNIGWAKGKSGVYIIKEDGKIVYVGYSSNNLYRTISRHFQEWNDRSSPDRVSYRTRLNYNKYTVRIIFASPSRALKLETGLIKKYKPRDNGEKIEIDLALNEEKKISEIVEEYHSTTPDYPSEWD